MKYKKLEREYLDMLFGFANTFANDIKSDGIHSFEDLTIEKNGYKRELSFPFNVAYHDTYNNKYYWAIISKHDTKHKAQLLLNDEEHYPYSESKVVIHYSMARDYYKKNDIILYLMVCWNITDLGEYDLLTNDEFNMALVDIVNYIISKDNMTEEEKGSFSFHSTKLIKPYEHRRAGVDIFNESNIDNELKVEYHKFKEFLIKYDSIIANFKKYLP